MFVDPHQFVACANAEHDERVHAGQREQLASELHPWHQPVRAALAAVRLTAGSGLVHLGQRVQGHATPVPA